MSFSPNLNQWSESDLDWLIDQLYADSPVFRQEAFAMTQDCNPTPIGPQSDRQVGVSSTAEATKIWSLPH